MTRGIIAVIVTSPRGATPRHRPHANCVRSRIGDYKIALQLLDRYLSSVEPGEREAREGLVVGTLLIAQDANRDLLAKQ